jgi:hypothetical protein
VFAISASKRPAKGTRPVRVWFCEHEEVFDPRLNTVAATPENKRRPIAAHCPSTDTRAKVPKAVSPTSVTPPASSDDDAGPHRRVVDLSEVDERPGDAILAELRAFEAKFARYAAKIETSELLTRLMSELRVTQRLAQTAAPDVCDHVERLSILLRQVRVKVDIAQPVFQGEVRLQALAAVADLRVALADGPARAEDAAGALAERWRALQPHDGRTNKGFQGMIDGNLAQVAEITGRPYSARARLMAEMRAVQTRIIAVRRERVAAPLEEQQELDTEFDALMEQQADLTERFTALP